MALSFVETAILRIVDQSSATLKKINRQILALIKTGQRLSKINLKVGGIAKATSDVNKIKKLLTDASRPRTVKLGANVGVAKTKLTDIKKDLTSISRLRSVKIQTNLGDTNAKLKTLRTTVDQLTGKSVKVPILTPGINKVLKKLREVEALQKRINGGVSARVSTNARAPIPSVAAGGGGVRGPRRSGLPGYYGGGVAGAATRQLLQGDSGSALSIGTAYMTIRAANITATTAVQATVESQSVDTATNLIIKDERVKSVIEDIGTRASLGTTNVTQARGRTIARDLFVTGFRDEVLQTVAPLVAKLESAAIAIKPNQADQITTLSNKLGNIAAVTTDPNRAAELVAGVFKAAVIQGETFNGSTMIAALRTSNVSQTIDQEGLIRFAAAVDELGRRAGEATGRLSQILTTSADQAGAGSGVSKGVVKDLIAAGLRTETGVIQPELFSRDPLRWVEEVIGGKLRERGLDARKTEDRSEVKTLLQQMGINGTALRLVLNELAAGNERDRALELADTLDPNRVAEAAAKDLGFQLKNLVTQFKSFSAEGLTPLFESLAPMVSEVAQVVQVLAASKDPMDRLSAAIGVTAAAVLAFKGAMGVGKLLGFGAASSSLLTAGTELQVAAAALTRAAGAQAGTGLGGGGKKGSTGKINPAKLILPAAVLGGFAYNSVKENDRLMALPAKERVAEVADKLERRDQTYKDLSASIEKAVAFGFGEGVSKFLFGGSKDLPSQAAQYRKSVAEHQAANDPAVLRVAEITELKKRIDQLQPIVDAQKAASNPLVPNPSLKENIAELNTLKGQLMGQTNQAKANLDASFASGASAVKDSIVEPLLTFGPEIGRVLINAAPEIGAGIADAFRNSVGTLDVNARVQTPVAAPRLDTAPSLPF